MPHVPVAERLAIDDLGYTDDGIIHVTARFGYMDRRTSRACCALIGKAEIECPIEVDDASYFLSTDRSRGRRRAGP